MSYSKSFIYTLFLIILCLPHKAMGASPLLHSCFSQQKYNANTTFHSNLNQTLSLLSTTVPPTGFGLGSIGQGQNQVNALALCRGDISTTNCKSCVIDAIKDITNRCPNKKGAIIWYNHCMLKYSNVEFFGKIDIKNKFYMIKIRDTNNSVASGQQVNELLSSLSDEACGNTNLYANGGIEMGGSMKLYGMVQCTGDLSSLDCKKCLDGAISDLSTCCNGKRGGRVIGGSCNIRYEFYPIIDT